MRINALDKILRDATTKGLKFISDRDARPPGGLHRKHIYGIMALTPLLN